MTTAKSLYNLRRKKLPVNKHVRLILGASDDGIACAVLLEVMRAFVKERKKPLLHPIVFLFNGAEENVLQASHGFITQHPWAKEVCNVTIRPTFVMVVFKEAFNFLLVRA